MLVRSVCDGKRSLNQLQNEELQDAQAGIAAALAHLSCNSSMQFTLVGKGLAGAVCSLIANAPSACMPSVSKVISAVAREGSMQGSVLVRAGVGTLPLVSSDTSEQQNRTTQVLVK